MAIIGVGGGLEPSRGVLRLRLDRVLTISERKAAGKVLLWPHNGRQMYLPKSRVGRRQGGCGQGGLHDLKHQTVSTLS